MRWLLLAAILSACGDEGGESGDASTIDGLPRDAGIDAPPDGPTAVRRVTCPTNPNQAITTSNFMFTPASISITRDQIVKLMPEMVHRIVPHTTKPSDPGINSGPTGEMRCVQFTEAGAFNYQCGPHPSMMGVVNVSN